MVPDNTPVIIGVGQASDPLGVLAYQALSPMELAAEAARAAVGDCHASGGVGAMIDTIAAIRQFEISSPVAVAPFGGSNNPPRSIAKRIGADPRRAILEISGGQGSQKLVGEIASEIAAGRSSLAMIVGSEAISTMLALRERGVSADWSETVEGDLEDRGFGVEGLADPTMTKHGMTGAVAGYALFENARRARMGHSLAAYRQAIGALFEPFTVVAAANPHAAAPIVRTAAALAQVSDQNRIIAEPYPRLTVAREKVNQAAALILSSAGRARELGIPPQQWIHIHAVTNADEASPLQRLDLSRSPAATTATSRALELAGKTMAEMDILDFYSCFAIAVFNITDKFNIPLNDPRGLTVTGGLPFFGGAGNNYSTHAIAEMVIRLRQKPGQWGLVGANGGLMSKYAVGIYSSTAASWTDIPSRVDSLPNAATPVPVLDEASGRARLESYTIIPDQRGDLGVIVGRLSAGGGRLAAVVAEHDSETMDILQNGEPFGRFVDVSKSANGRNIFTFIN